MRISDWSSDVCSSDLAKHFGVMEHIRFKTRVTRIEPKDGIWLVTLDDGAQKRFRSVLVANGHLWDPRTAQFDGHFDGDRKSGVEGKSVSVRVDLGGRRIIQKKKKQRALTKTGQ